MIKVNKLKKYYNKNRGIEDVSFEISKGEIYGLIGPNGAGKTTAIRILNGLLKEDSGSASISGYSIPKNLDKIKNKVGYLPGEVNYYSDMKVKDFLQFNRKFYKDPDIKYEEELIDKLQIDLNKKIKELSLGNKKKVAIVQSLIHRPEYLILDEPTNGLDPLLQQILYEIILEEKEKGTAILFSSHILSEVEKICDRVGIIKDGDLIKEYSINELKNISIKNITIYGLENPEILTKKYKITRNYKGNNYDLSLKSTELKEFFDFLSKLEFLDIEIQNPKLEETFIEFYK